MRTAIRLSPEDNILVLAQSVQSGEAIEIDGEGHRISDALGLGHKVAARKIAPGEKILKYGVPIGSATAAIEPGEHVHLHNMKSDYLPTFTLDEGREFHSTK